MPMRCRSSSFRNGLSCPSSQARTSSAFSTVRGGAVVRNHHVPGFRQGLRGPPVQLLSAAAAVKDDHSRIGGVERLQGAGQSGAGALCTRPVDLGGESVAPAIRDAGGIEAEAHVVVPRRFPVLVGERRRCEPLHLRGEGRPRQRMHRLVEVALPGAEDVVLVARVPLGCARARVRCRPFAIHGIRALRLGRGGRRNETHRQRRDDRDQGRATRVPHRRQDTFSLGGPGEFGPAERRFVGRVAGESRASYDSDVDSVKAVAPANEEAVEAWNGVLFDRFVQFRDIDRRGARGPRRRGDARPSAEPGRPRARHRLRLRRHHPAAGRAGRPATARWSASTRPSASSRRRAERPRRPVRPTSASRWATSRRPASTSASTTRSPASARCSSPTRWRRCATSARRSARRPPVHGRLAPEARQRVALQGGAGGRADGRGGPRLRRAHLRPRAVLDGERRHHERDPRERRLRGHQPAPLRPRVPLRRQPRRRRWTWSWRSAPPARRSGSPATRPSRWRLRSGRPSARRSPEFVTDDGVRASSSTWIVAATAPSSLGERSSSSRSLPPETRDGQHGADARARRT